MNRLSKFKALTLRERVLLFQSAILLPVTALGLRLFGTQKWQKVLASLTRKTANAAHVSTPVASKEVETVRAKQIARLVRAAANHGVYRANCLEQSLVLWAMLKRAGLESEIRFGARKEQNELQAHAWVECMGLTLNEDRGVEQRYAPFSGVLPPTPLKPQ